MSAVMKISWRRFAVVLLLAFCLAGCGGGGGSAKTGTLVDPAPAYKGATAQAQVSATNAENLMFSAFSGGGIGSSIGAIPLGKKSAGGRRLETIPILALSQSLKLSVRRMGIPKKASLLRAANDGHRREKTASRSNSFQIPGDYGGSATVSLEINDSTGSFYGSVTYDRFSSNGVSANGKADLLGNFDANRQDLSSLTISTTGLDLNFPGAALVLTGDISWVFNNSSATETLSMNMVVLDQGNYHKTYWFNNYRITTTGSSNSVESTVAGRYYDHDLGYVDLSTQSHLVTPNDRQWPSQGLLLANGKSGGWIGAEFHDTTVTIQADANGDGTAEWETERPLDTITPLYSPPVAEAGPDQTVTERDLVQLDGSASRAAAGVTLSYNWTFTSMPGFMPPPLTGANTATPSFTPTAVGSYQLQLTVSDGRYSSNADTVTVVVTAATPLHPDSLFKVWQYGTYGTSIGLAGLYVSDINGDGTPEIIASGSTGGGSYIDIWYVLRKTDNGEYEQIWRSGSYGAIIVRIVLADLNHDGRDDVVVALEDGTVHMYDGSTLQELRSFTTAASLRDMAVADLDGDGVQEIVTTDGIGIRIYNGDSGILKQSLSMAGGRSIAVGDVDGDAHPEIVTTAYGGKGYVVDGVTGAVKWEYADGFGAMVRLGDLNGAGRQSIVGASAWEKITVFDAVQKTATWSIATTTGIGAIVIADTDGDGVPEIVYGDGQWGSLHAVDVVTRTDKWAIGNARDGISGIAVGDVDLDGKIEVLWGVGGYDSGPDYLFVSDPQTRATKWQSPYIFELSPLAVGDLDGGGANKLVMMSGYYDGVFHIFDARTHRLEYQKLLPASDMSALDRVMRIVDVDGDGRNELVTTTSILFDGSIRVYDGTTHAVKRASSTYPNTTFGVLAAGDVDGDGKAEVVTGANSLVVLDGTTLQEKWRGPTLGGNLFDVKIADLDQDGRREIVAVTSSTLVIVDGVSHATKGSKQIPAHTVEVADMDGDGAPEILIGRTDGNIDIYDGVTLELKRTIYTFIPYAVDALRAADLDGSGSKKLVFASAGRLTIMDGQKLSWRSSYLGNNLGWRNSIEVQDTEGDGHSSIYIGCDSELYHFKYQGIQ